VVEALDDGVVEDRSTVTRYLASARQQVHQLETLSRTLRAIPTGRGRAPAAPYGRTHVRPGGRGHGECRAQADAASIRLETRLDADLPLVFVDGERIGRVLLNLLSNALAIRLQAELSRCSRSTGTARRSSACRTPAPASRPTTCLTSSRASTAARSRALACTAAPGWAWPSPRGLVEAHGGRMWPRASPAPERRCTSPCPAPRRRETVPADPGVAATAVAIEGTD